MERDGDGNIDERGSSTAGRSGTDRPADAGLDGVGGRPGGIEA